MSVRCRNLCLVVLRDAVVWEVLARDGFLEDLHHPCSFWVFSPLRKDFATDHFVQIEVVLVVHTHIVTGPRFHESAPLGLSNHRLFDGTKRAMGLGAVRECSDDIIKARFLHLIGS